MSTTTKVAYVAPAIDQRSGQQKMWNDMYVSNYQLENGMQGEVLHKNQQPRFKPGDEVVAEMKPAKGNFPPAMKLSSPGDAGGYGNGRRRDNDDDPVHNAKLQAAGLVQAAMRAGAQTEEAIMELAMRGLRVSERLKDLILEQQQKNAQPPQQQAAPPPPAQPQPWQNGGMNAQGFHQPAGAPPSMRQPLPQNPGANGTWQGSNAPKPQYQEEQNGPF